MNQNVLQFRQYTERFIDKIVVHPQFNRITLENDIALLRMDKPVSFQSNINAICLPNSLEHVGQKTAYVLRWQLDISDGKYY